MASGLLPKLPVSSSLCDEVPHIFIPISHLEPREYLISSAKRLLQQYRPIADKHGCGWIVRYVPIAINAPQQTAYLFDHLVGDREHGRRHGGAKRRRYCKSMGR
jgi:hypothetical protein